MRTPGKLLSGILAGAGAMYLLNPDRGGRRRALLRDEVIKERARSTLGRVLSRPGAIGVAVYEGRVVLSGPVLAREHARAISAVKGVRGVRDVEDQLEPHGSADAVRALQGGAHSGKRRSASRRESWPRATRLLAAAAGSMALARGLLTGGRVGGTLGAIGAGVLARAASNLPIRRWFGVRAGRGAVKSVPEEGKTSAEIRAPW